GPGVLDSAVYRDSVVTLDWAAQWNPSGDGQLLIPADPGGSGVIRTDSWSFRSDATGWSLAAEGALPGCTEAVALSTHNVTCAYTATGTGGFWTDPPLAAIPLAGTGWLLLLGCVVASWWRPRP